MNALLVFHYFIFFGRIALSLVSYAAKIFAAKILVTKMSMAYILRVKISDEFSPIF